MALYKGRKILKHWALRPMDPEKIIPDCICYFTFTDDYHLYLLEDDYNGEYTEHLSIPIEQILDIDQEEFNSSDEEKETSNSNAATNIVTTFLAAFGGVLVVPGNKKKRTKKYLRLCYVDEFNDKKLFYFDDCQNDLKSIVKFFRAYKG